MGHIAGPLLILGSVSLILGFTAEFLGLFGNAEQRLLGMWESSENSFNHELGATSPVGILLGAALGYGLVGAILGTPGMGRRFVLGLSAFALGLALSPVMAVWGIYWKPFGLCLTGLWAWFSAMIYTHGHRMPCEVSAEDGEAQNVISMEEERPSNAKQELANG